MGQATAATIAALNQFKHNGTSTRQYPQSYPFLRLINKVPVVTDGANLNFPVEFERGDSALSSFATVGDDFPAAATGINATGVLAITEVQQTAAYDDLAAGIARANSMATPSGPSSIDGMLANSEVSKAVHIVYRDMNSSLYTGNPAATKPQLAGITLAGGTATFAGIDPTDSGKEAYQGKNATESLANFTSNPEKVIRAMIDSIRDNKGSCAVALCRSGLISIIRNSIRSADSQVRHIRVGGRNIDLADLGGNAVRVDGCVFVEDAAAPSNKIAFISPEYVDLGYVDQRKISNEAIAAAMSELMRRDISPEAVAELLGSPLELPPLYFKELGVTATQEKIGIAGQAQVAWRRRDVHGLQSLT